ncbi:MAG: ABC transporter ATP-binding protein [Defluviitaleaceae bacterium]|nr:ABC transporter ATP-binding protein [Defluviitaleaceae bacterium]
MVHIDNLSKTFDNHKALDGLNLNIKKGSIYGLVGVNGSGKTTAIKHLAGIYRQDSGSVTIDGQTVYDNAALKAKVGYIPDELFFFAGYNLGMTRRFYSNMYATWDNARYNTLISLLQLDDSRRLNRFSKGMQKQAAFALSLSIMPEVLILDEPIDGLDPIVRKDIFSEIIRDVADRGMTVLISSHNLKEMDDICDAVGIIKDGKMVVERDLDDLKTDVHKIQVAFEIGADKLESSPGLTILHRESRGTVDLLVIRGSEEDISVIIKGKNPLVYDHLPLTLEEIFIYENKEIEEGTHE